MEEINLRLRQKEKKEEEENYKKVADLWEDLPPETQEELPGLILVADGVLSWTELNTSVSLHRVRQLEDIRKRLNRSERRLTPIEGE